MSAKNWTQKEITQWAVNTFGSPVDLVDIIDRADLEMVEAIDAAYDARQGISSWNKVLSELADVYIVMCQVAEHLGADLQEEVNKKMEVNSLRKWVKTGEGVGRHK